ncbi:DUF72 domain-containing protein [Umezawaea beigongshangensis]|uniref:DUF72 domain-containing protein n=1 Tax=Umezawaea beigongshangensis TaxID=2780383 RepID=UPI0018F1B552|nr:DUF72 domain-containing protein [Umezawaea beigongshangensis]
MGEIGVGTSGRVHPLWRGTFCPAGLARRRESEHLSRRPDSAEVSGSCHSSQRPSSFRTWVEQTPDDFVFAVEGGGFTTRVKRLRDVRTPLADFFASGVLAPGGKLGPLPWQIPPTPTFDRELLTAFSDLLPRTALAAALAERLRDG